MTIPFHSLVAFDAVSVNALITLNGTPVGPFFVSVTGPFLAAVVFFGWLLGALETDASFFGVFAGVFGLEAFFGVFAGSFFGDFAGVFLGVLAVSFFAGVFFGVLAGAFFGVLGIC